MEQRNEPKTAELIKNARYCCGDIKCEGEKDCGDYCLDGRDDRNGDLRWCRQWLVHDLADRLESQAKENEISRHLIEMQSNVITELTARAEQAERERDAAVEHVHDAIFGTNHSCFYCTMENCDGCTNSTVKEHFKYRMEKPSKYITKIED